MLSKIIDFHAEEKCQQLASPKANNQTRDKRKTNEEPIESMWICLCGMRMRMRRYDLAAVETINSY